MSSFVISKKLTDITSSESNLSRFSEIVYRIHKEGYVNENKITEICKKTGINHPKVIGRHLHILKTINLINKESDYYMVTSYGKAMANFYKESEKLSIKEKSLFFKLFFSSIYTQLFYMLKTIYDNKSKYDNYKTSFENNIIEYFSINRIQKMWNKKTILYSIKHYKEYGILKRGIENKYETMLNWMTSMDLVEKSHVLRLSSKGEYILEILKDINSINFTNKIEFSSLSLINKKLNDNLKLHYNTMKKEYEDSFTIFVNNEGYGDLIAINNYVSINLAKKYGILLMGQTLKALLNELQKNGVVDSYILNRRGELAILQIK